ncbi:MAG TPA: NAD(P)/FAD-dependent oxidoreductase [Candidatus Limnocylindria bacterium]|nr:NAD(P)/FAD-dependent oxidoreductase [Candidatus Limnocylindria bacterium]
MPDAVVVGAGPNGLAAAIQVARAGRTVAVYEANDEIGGGARSAALTLPGFVHDVCSAFHPLALASPFLRDLRLGEHGLRFIHPGAPLAHPLDDGSAVVLERSLDATARGLGTDGDAYASLMAPFVRSAADLYGEVLGPAVHVPRHPLLLARFGLLAMRSSRSLAGRFHGEGARALVAGLAAHSFLPLEHPFTAALALLLGVGGHAVGWPVARGGSGEIARALGSYLRALGGNVITGRRVQQMSDLPTARAYLFDTTPAQLELIAADRLSAAYRRSLRRYRRGPGVFKIDYALDGPMPWRAAACLRAGTVHVGGTFDEISASERAVWRGEHPERPFVLVGQQSLFDDTRAPAGKHTLWAYCHVPNGSTEDMTARIEAQLERFAPGFAARVLARRVSAPADIERANANDLGGDISNGSHAGLQLLMRPRIALDPYATSARDLYLCSAATPPGGGVHGMCGYHAARSALRRTLA